MSVLCDSFDSFFALWGADLHRLCLALSRSPGDGRELEFQSFLRLGAARDPHIGEREARLLLFSSAYRLCSDYYLKKMRKRPKRGGAGDAFYAFICLPFDQRAALCLSLFGFDEADIALIMQTRVPRIRRLLHKKTPEGWQQAVSSIILSDDDVMRLSDRIYERFAERSVGVENKIHGLRSAFDRAAPYLALAVLALFAFSVWFVSR